MIQFKQIAFIRLRREMRPNSENYSRIKIEELKATLRNLLDWSFIIERHEINEVYMNYENKAIYNNGLIIKRLDSGDYEVQLVTCVPRDICTTTLGTSFKQHKNYINYSYQKSTFYSNPVQFFESLGYKIQNNFEYKDVEYYKSLTFGVEIVLYPKHAYIQINEDYINKPQVDNYQSAGHQLIKSLASFLDDSVEVILSSGNMKPQDFLQEYN